MFKLNNKNTGTYFTPFSIVPTVDSEQINVSSCILYKCSSISLTQPTFICLKLTMERPEQCVKYVQG